MKKSRLLVLAEYIGENHNSTAYYWAQIVKQLQSKYDLVLITPNTEHAQQFSAKYNVSTRYVKFAKHDKNSLLSRFVGQLKQTYSFLKAIEEEMQDQDLVFSGTNPILTMFALAASRIRKPFKWLVLVHDVFPNNLVPAKVIRPSGLVYRLLTYFSKKVYSSPDHLICIGRDMKRLLEEKTGKNKNIAYIPNWASTEIISCSEKKDNEIIRHLKWEDKVVFQFFGNIGRLQGIPDLLKAIKLSKHSQARFLFIGCGSESKSVKEIAESVNKKHSFERVHYFGRLDLEKNNIGLNACDVALVTLAPSMLGLGVPSKAYFSMAADKPILYVGDEFSELSLLLTEHKLGWFCEDGKPEKLADLLDYITDLYVNTGCADLHPRDVLANHFSEKMALNAVVDVVEELVKK